MKSFTKTVVILIFFCSSLKMSAQVLPDSVTGQIEGFLSPWNKNTSPGYSFGIIQNDSLVYTKSVGMANIEYAIPNTPSTVFNIGSMAKQFTAFDIFLLAKEKKLNIDDDIRKYLNSFPDMKRKITIRHLLYHTSGIRDYVILLQIAGTRLDDIVTNEHVLKILSKQIRLNSIPGDKYSYSNSNYVLLAEIVKNVSGQSFRQFTDSAIFHPLGMTSSYFQDNCCEIHKNRSYSYHRIDSSHFKNDPLNYSAVGASGMYSNVIDLAKWITNFNKHLVWDKDIIDQLSTKTRLNDGRELNGAAGLVVTPYLGWRQFYFSGEDGGYRSFQNFFPNLKTGVIVLSNLSDYLYNNNLPYGSTNLLIPKDTTHWELMPRTWADSASSWLDNPSAYSKFCGDYITDEAGFVFQFKLVENKMYAYIGGGANLMGKVSGDTFMTVNSYQFRYIFNRKTKEPTITILDGDGSFTLRKYIKDTVYSITQLKEYLGRYYCPELECFYNIELRGKELILTNNKYNDEKLGIVGVDHLSTNNWWMNHLAMLRNNKNEVTGFEVNTGRVMHLNFVKVL